MCLIKWPLDITWQVVKSHARVIESKVVVDRVAVASRAAHTVRVLIGAGVCGLVRLVRMRGREKARGERRDHKRKRKRMIKLPRPLKPPVARGQMHFLGEKMKTKNTPKLCTPRENTKDNFSILVLVFFYWLVWFFSLGGWAAGLRSGRLTHNQLCPALDVNRNWT